MKGRKTRTHVSTIMIAQINASALPELVNGWIWYLGQRDVGGGCMVEMRTAGTVPR
jgi:hypothetical protein